MTLSEERRLTILRLHDEGHSPNGIRNRTGAHNFTVARVLYEAGKIDAPPQRSPSRMLASERRALEQLLTPTPPPPAAPRPTTDWRPRRGDSPNPIRWWAEPCAQCRTVLCSHVSSAA